MATSTTTGHRAADLVLPSYPEMIVEAIASLAEENGSSQAAIARRIEAARGAGGGLLPPSHPALVAAHLSRMSAAGELVAVAGGKYALRPTPPPPPAAAAEEFPADDDSADDLPPSPPPPPPKRGRGRPPKVRPPGYPGVPAAPAPAPVPVGAPVDGSVAAAAPTVPRRRGRPPKPRDPHAPPKIPRPRGRPRKNPLPEGMVPPPRPGATTKPRPQFAEVGFVEERVWVLAATAATATGCRRWCVSSWCCCYSFVAGAVLLPAVYPVSVVTHAQKLQCN